MAFVEYEVREPVHKKLLDGERASLTKWYINLGEIKPTSEYVRLQYDTDAMQFKLVPGESGAGYKTAYKKGQWQINAKGFTQAGYLPQGIYRKVESNGDDPFELVFEFERPHRNWRRSE